MTTLPHALQHAQAVKSRDIPVISKDFGLWKKGFFQMPRGALKEIRAIAKSCKYTDACERIFAAMTDLSGYSNIVAATPAQIAAETKNSTEDAVTRDTAYRVLKHLEKHNVIVRVPVEKLEEFLKCQSGSVSLPNGRNFQDCILWKVSHLEYVYVISHHYYSRGTLFESSKNENGLPGKGTYQKHPSTKRAAALRQTGELFMDKHIDAVQKFENLFVPTVDEFELEGLASFLPHHERDSFNASDPDDINALYLSAKHYLETQAAYGNFRAKDILHRI